MTIDYKIDIGHILTASVLVLGFAIQYGVQSNRLTVVETQLAKTADTNQSLVITLHSLENTIIKVQTQMDERERRFDQAQYAAQTRQAQRELHQVGSR
jgi:hypothetical protein